MAARLSMYAPVVLILTAALTTACNRSSATPTSPDSLAATESAIKAEPQFAEPEFLPDGSCAARQPFGLRLSVIVGGRDDVILRALSFRLTDGFGATTLPSVLTGETSSAVPPMGPMVPMSVPGSATLPASTIPIPGSSSINGLFVSAGTFRPLPFFLRFGCGVIPSGAVFIDADAADRFGRPSSSHLRVGVRH